MHFIQIFLFGYYPYICLGVFIFGCLLRFNYAQYGWKSESSQLLSTRGMRIGNNLFHIGILFLLCGHFIGLLTPDSLTRLVISTHAHQILAMTSGGIAGIICFIGINMLLYRRLFNPRIRATSSIMDILILVLIYIQLVLGLSTIPESYHHISGTLMESLANWAQHIVTFRAGAANYVFHAPLIFKIHILLGLTIFLVFPFTRLVHMISAPIWYLGRVGYQLVRRRKEKTI